MTFTYNGTTYTVDQDSTYKDIIIPASSLEQACTIATAVQGMTSYTFNVKNYTNMVVKKVAIVIEGSNHKVVVYLREKTDLEVANAKIQAMYDAIQDVGSEISDETANEHLCLYPNINDVDTIIPGHRYVYGDEVIFADGTIEQSIEEWISHLPTFGGHGG